MNEKNVDITANIKTDNVEDVEEFFDDVKKSYNKIATFDEFDDEPNNKTGRKYDEENEEDDLIVQAERKLFEEFPDEYQGELDSNYWIENIINRIKIIEAKLGI